ncbi:hypothetical protein BDK51DRAFT_46981 [Blyttiomyces helicus]|uniref:Uncharacterized protein n=1 Tax=Blyttiomyces helicus TaxID=388810 RepID=A0A4P9W359_9FUNG|nr:hypothetical protein BDK51DRAFT_46981 [Blyttiomyces helicus]|eukprot:RKO86212.1 hypothetical protein BDK51DRAFT_46981 [Blyttiomyces helicus]
MARALRLSALEAAGPGPSDFDGEVADQKQLDEQNAILEDIRKQQAASTSTSKPPKKRLKPACPVDVLDSDDEDDFAVVVQTAPSAKKRGKAPAASVATLSKNVAGKEDPDVIEDEHGDGDSASNKKRVMSSSRKTPNKKARMSDEGDSGVEEVRASVATSSEKKSNRGTAFPILDAESTDVIEDSANEEAPTPKLIKPAITDRVHSRPSSPSLKPSTVLYPRSTARPSTASSPAGSPPPRAKASKPASRKRQRSPSPEGPGADGYELPAARRGKLQTAFRNSLFKRYGVDPVAARKRTAAPLWTNSAKKSKTKKADSDVETEETPAPGDDSHLDAEIPLARSDARQGASTRKGLSGLLAATAPPTDGQAGRRDPDSDGDGPKGGEGRARGTRLGAGTAKKSAFATLGRSSHDPPERGTSGGDQSEFGSETGKGVRSVASFESPLPAVGGVSSRISPAPSTIKKRRGIFTPALLKAAQKNAKVAALNPNPSSPAAAHRPSPDTTTAPARPSVSDREPWGADDEEVNDAAAVEKTTSLLPRAIRSPSPPARHSSLKEGTPPRPKLTLPSSPLVAADVDDEPNPGAASPEMDSSEVLVSASLPSRMRSHTPSPSPTPPPEDYEPAPGSIEMVENSIAPYGGWMSDAKTPLPNVAARAAETGMQKGGAADVGGGDDSSEDDPLIGSSRSRSRRQNRIEEDDDDDDFDGPPPLTGGRSGRGRPLGKGKLGVTQAESGGTASSASRRSKQIVEVSTFGYF